MRSTTCWFRQGTLGLCAALVAGAAWSTEPAAPLLRDPVVPEALRHSIPAVATRGAALKAQVQTKLRAGFEQADASQQGHITRAQAESAGLGFVARHFDAIDTSGHGSVSWAQVEAYLAQRQRQR